MVKRVVKAIAAMTPERVIGQVSAEAADFPQDWNYPKDLARFRELTKGQPILMGKTTFLSFPEDRRPLPNRLNIVATRQEELVDKSENVKQISDPLRFIKDYLKGEGDINSDTLWIIGGGEIYKATMPLWHQLYLTTVNGLHEGNVFFPEFEDKFEEDISERIEEDDHTMKVYVPRDPEKG